MRVRNRADREDREADYMDWHHQLGGCYAMDLDNVEIRFRSGEPYAAAFVELQRADGGFANETYLESVLYNWRHETMKYKVAAMMGRVHGCNAFGCVYPPQLDRFWIYNISKDKGWFELTEAQWKKFLKDLK